MIFDMIIIYKGDNIRFQRKSPSVNFGCFFLGSAAGVGYWFRFPVGWETSSRPPEFLGFGCGSGGGWGDDEVYWVFGSKGAGLGPESNCGCEGIEGVGGSMFFTGASG